MTNISIVNQSTLFKDTDLAPLANAIAIMVARDFGPAWGVDARIFYTPSGKNPSPDHWPLFLLDDADQAGELGVHDLSPTGLPLGKAFVRTTQAAGDQISVTVSHEICELLADPDVNLSAEVDTTNGPSKFYAYEVCDPCELDADGYTVVIPPGWTGAGQQILVSNFVLPAWFESFRTMGPFDFKNLLTAPFTLRPGGYISLLDLANLSAGWQQITAKTMSAQRLMAARAGIGSRRSRRALRRSEWLLSTYATSDASVAIPTGVAA